MDPVSIAHPSAASVAPAGRPPRYLVRRDGVVLDYHPALARLSTFEPAEELPDWHLRGIEAATRREARRQELLLARQARLSAAAGDAAGPSGTGVNGAAPAQVPAAPRRRPRGGAR